MHEQSSTDAPDEFIDPDRSRWDGVLTPEQVAFCRQRGLPLAYDCAQIGWVLATPRVLAEVGWARGRDRDPDVPAATTGPREEFAFRPWTQADLPVYTAILRNRNVWRFLPDPYPEPFTEETARGLMEIGSFEFLHEALAVVRDGRPIGQCLYRPDRTKTGLRTAEVAYWLGEEHWGKGYMSRILPLFTKRCFRVHHVDVLYAWIRDDHGASARVAERTGFRPVAEGSDRPGFVRYEISRPGEGRLI